MLAARGAGGEAAASLARSHRISSRSLSDVSHRAAGVRCSINADDPLLFGPDLLEEYELCRTQFGFDDTTMAAIAATSIEASGANADHKAAGLAGVEAWLTAAP